VNKAKKKRVQKPTPEQAAWVISKVVAAMKHPGSFRYMIYNRMGYGPNAYVPIYEAGGMELTNAFLDLHWKKANETGTAKVPRAT
jgi:hypothetical protein